MTDAAIPLAVLLAGGVIVTLFAFYLLIKDDGATKRAKDADDDAQAELDARFAPPAAITPAPVAELVVAPAVELVVPVEIPAVVEATVVPPIPEHISNWLAFWYSFPTAKAAEAAMHTDMTDWIAKVRTDTDDYLIALVAEQPKAGVR